MRRAEKSRHTGQLRDAVSLFMERLLLETLRLGVLKIKPQLPESGCLCRIHPRLQIGFFHKVAPPGASVFLTLTPFEIVQSSLRALSPFDDRHNSARYVGFLVEPNDRERMLRVVSHFLIFRVEIRTGQSESPPSSSKRSAQKTLRRQNTFPLGFRKWPLGVNDVAPLGGNVADSEIRTAKTIDRTKWKNVIREPDRSYTDRALVCLRGFPPTVEVESEEMNKDGKGKGRDLGYALAASSCEGAISVEYAPSRPSMRSLLSQFQTPTTPRRVVGFFGSSRSLGRPNELIAQLTLDWPTFVLVNPFSRRRGLK